MKIRKLLSDWMLIQLDPRKETTPGGIIRTSEQPVWTGVVQMAGPGRQYRDKFVPMEEDIEFQLDLVNVAKNFGLTTCVSCRVSEQFSDATSPP